MRTKWSPLLLTIIAAVLMLFFPESAILKTNQIVSAEGNPEQNEEPVIIKVILERAYLDGEVSQEVVEETIRSAEDFWAKYDQWQLIDMDLEHLVFRQQMDDISPLLKSNGYFGITDEGVLTIFNGRPQKTNIIQSFFQIDLGKLESTKCEELRKGIPIITKDRHVEVLETFKNYLIIEKQAQ